MFTSSELTTAAMAAVREIHKGTPNVKTLAAEIAL